MRIFVTGESDRITLDINEGDTVEQVREIIRDVMSLGPDEGPEGSEAQDKKVLTLHFAGADLDPQWILSDVGVTHGSTVRIIQREAVKPLLFIHCAYNDETVPVVDKFHVPNLRVRELRAIVTRKTGIPVGVFRLVNSFGTEMFDSHTLDEYGLDMGDTVRMETWDGWNDFLNLTVMGFASHVLNRLSVDDTISRFQMKVALYIAAHYGHADLALSLVRLGIKASEPIGDHPCRLWCRGQTLHIDSLRAPVHVAAEMGQLNVVRAFVHHDVANVLAKDGNDLTPLSISLRKKQKGVASFLLTKQWSKINYTQKHAIQLSLFVKMKRWAERAKEKVLVVHGQWKSSVKHPRRHLPSGALVGYGVQLDGYSNSHMTSSSTSHTRQKMDKEARRRRRFREAMGTERNTGDLADCIKHDPETYFRSLGMMQQLQIPRMTKWGKMMSRAASDRSKSVTSESEAGSPSPTVSPRRVVPTGFPVDKPFRLPPITETPSKSTKVQIPVKQSLPKLGISGPENEELSLKSNEHSPRLTNTGSRSIFIQTPSQSDRRSHTSTDDDSRGQRVSGSEAMTPPRRKSVSFGNRAKGIGAHTSPTKLKMIPNRTSLPKAKRSNRKKKFSQTDTAALLIAKAKSEETGIPLPVHSFEERKPFNLIGLPQDTIEEYEKHRGLKAKDYAIKCLSVASRFKQKAWLQQVRHAMLIASRGVKRTVNGQPHIFHAQLSKSLRGDRLGQTKKFESSVVVV